jgi:hypothetical protein
VGCDECDGLGYTLLTQCGRAETQQLVTAINLAIHASKGTLPTAGGLLDQSAWFVAIWDTFEGDMATIAKEDQ